MKKTLAAALLALTLLPTLAVAQGADDCAAQRRRNPKAVCSLAITGEDVSGEVVAPTGEFKTLRTTTGLTPLIRERLSFVDKIFASAADL